MSRIHLFEWEDQPWFPAVIRDPATAYLRRIMEVSGQIEKISPIVARALDRGQTQQMVDLCSGGGGPVPGVVKTLRNDGRQVRASLTDRYPSEQVFREVADRHEGIEAVTEGVDARAVPPHLTGLRTLFNGFHHFRPEDAKAILKDAVEARQPICVVEVVGRNVPMIVGVLFSWIAVLLLMPTVRPVRLGWLVFTYLIPLVPLVVVWDGVVSCLRVYSEGELREMVKDLEGEGYRFEIGTQPLGPPGANGTYLIGWPVG